MKVTSNIIQEVNISHSLTKNLIQNLRCDRCDVPFELRTWKNKVIALSISRNKRRGFLCVKCISSSKNIGRTFYRTEEQLNEFVRKK